MDTPLKNTCFNKISTVESPEVPTDTDGTAKLITIDYSGYVGRWNNKQDSDYDFTEGLITVATVADSGSVKGDKIQTAVKLAKAANHKLSITLGKSFKANYFPLLAPVMTDSIKEKDVCNLTYECWSKECVSYIKYSFEDRQWQYTKSDEGDEGKDGTYLYAMIYDCPTEYRRHIETFEFKVTAQKKTVKWSLPAIPAD